MATREKPAQAERVTPPVSTLVRALAERVLHWIVGANRRDTDAQVQSEKDASACAQTEQVRQVAREPAECAKPEEDRVKADLHAAQILLATQSSLPLVSVCTKPDTTFYLRRIDLIAALTEGHRDVPLCFSDGSRVQSGGADKAKLRLSTIKAAKVAPCEVVKLASHMLDDQDRENAYDCPIITL